MKGRYSNNTAYCGRLVIVAGLFVLVAAGPSTAQAACLNGSPNGVQTAGEQCDDGNLVNTDNCLSTCLLPTCGDGFQDTVAPGVEFCDNGAANGTGAGQCNATCTRVQTCNDGFKDGTEQCDGPTAGSLPTASCDANCTTASCGDGTTNAAAGETCDDGNTTNANGTTDTCDSNCRAMACGNGVKSYDGGGVAEECDDGNATSCDGCGVNCSPEECGDGVVDGCGDVCDDGPNNGSGEGFCLSDCSAVQVCGNGIKNGTEQCDALVLPSAACDADCTLASCGDGTTNVARGEQCDDGNTTNANGTTDVCDSNCTVYACGNGVKGYRPGPVAEQCDDGNVTNGDGCGATCLLEFCGNGVTDPDEVCDQGPLNGQGPGVCNATCSRVQTCNDGFKDGTEACDGPVPASLPTATCDTDCTAAACGDGFTNAARGEQCDDGNTTNNDTCDSNCTLPGCGNDVTVPPEQCDDGNAAAGDGCFACIIEKCGDGFVSPVEACDHGDLNGAGNGLCLSDCSGVQLCGDFVIEGTEQCETLGGNTPACDSNCTLPVCGDRHVNLFAGEQCDDGNTVNGDGCDTNCKLTGCGNGIKTPNTFEQCDDGNNVSADGCDPVCGVEVCGDGNVDFGEACDNGPYNGFGQGWCLEDCSAVQDCGNGLIEGAEGCDDANFVDADGCDGNCQPTGCGNGYLTFGEQCDDGNMSPANGTTDFCDSNCTLPFCGNQVVSVTTNGGPLSPREACDDGNNSSGDGCSSNCLIDEGCGDGTTQGALGENCDDGNTTSGDFCDAACRLEDCGNANKTLNEACDDGNLNNADACIITSVTAGQDPAGPANCALARCGDGYIRAGVEACDGGENCTASCCDYGPGYETGILGAVCQWEALESGCGGYATCDKASTIEKQINRYGVLLQRAQQLIQEAKLDAAARKATVLARRAERLETRLLKYCGSDPVTKFCLRDLLDQLGTVLDSLDEDLLAITP